jgi:hypothetical protein
MVTAMSLAAYADKFSRLNVGRVGDHERPHKPVMLLGVLDLFDSGTIKENTYLFPPTTRTLWRTFRVRES